MIKHATFKLVKEYSFPASALQFRPSCLNSDILVSWQSFVGLYVGAKSFSNFYQEKDTAYKDFNV
jgi:hypothetical protein